MAKGKLKVSTPPFKPLRKKAKRGFKGHPLATLMLYGPDDKKATKVAVGIILEEGGEVVELRRWSHPVEVRTDALIAREIQQFIIEAGVKTVVMTDRINGCPHEEGIDYEGETCPMYGPFWAGRDRWTGEVIN